MKRNLKEKHSSINCTHRKHIFTEMFSLGMQFKTIGIVFLNGRRSKSVTDHHITEKHCATPAEIAELFALPGTCYFLNVLLLLAPTESFNGILITDSKLFSL